ncbi:MAG: efflux transporter outer membrane subunit [Planctomycetota bacterium]
MVIVAAMALLTGCTTSLGTWARNGFKVGPNYSRAPAPVADQWIDADAPQLASEPEDHSYWWAVFNDPVLNRLVDVASEDNLTLKVAGLRILEARAMRGVAAGNLFPQQQQNVGSFARNKITLANFPLDLSGFPFPIPLRENFDLWRYGFDAAWELDIWGKFRRAIEAADANLNAQVENYDDVLVMLQAEVAGNYIQMRTLEERIELARQNADLQKKVLVFIEKRFAEGRTNELDPHQARSDLAITEAAIPALEIEHRKTRNRLCVLLGIPPGRLQEELAGPARVPTAPPQVVVGIPAELLRRRPDIRRAEREAAAQCAQIGVAEAELYPQFSITGTILVEAPHFQKLFDHRAFTGTIGPGLRWNILNYGRIRNNVRVEEARFNQLMVQYQNTVLKANEEVENAIVSFLREQKRVKFLDESVGNTQAAYKILLAQGREGRIDSQRVLESQRALVLRQDNLAASRGNVALNLVAVYKALGGGWQARLSPDAAPTVPADESAPPDPIPGGTPEAMLPAPLPPVGGPET